MFQFQFQFAHDLFDLLNDCDASPCKDGGKSWRHFSSCAQTDPEAFFPEKGGSTRAAKSVCVNCPVKNECLEFALDNGERFGVWGGMSERERRKEAKRRGMQWEEEEEPEDDFYDNAVVDTSDADEADGELDDPSLDDILNALEEEDENS